MNFCVCGAGAWGTAMAVHLNRKGHTVTLVPRRFDQAELLTREGENRAYLPGIQLNPDLQIGFEILPSIMEAEVVLFATPSAGLRAIAEQVAAAAKAAWSLKMVVALCKGLEAGTHKMAPEVLADVFPDLETGILSGPTHAMEVALGYPTAMVLGVKTRSPMLEATQEALHDETLRVYSSTDPQGVALGGCLKNVYAIAAGISDGLGLGDNAKAALITRSLAEMVEVGVALGGERQTFMGLGGVGDLIATCHGEWSRNRRFGAAIAKGSNPRSLVEEQRTVVEGYGATQILHDWAREVGAETPILDEVYAVLYDTKLPQDALKALMRRGFKAESETV
ncbi:MAG: NAD(P)H-dependent glycerol-3-phosphate dehydrogenase [Puniceicoccaceae bacterium]